ncbi:MAG: CoA transferase [Bradyrhizobiaceae bacterium]|nr:CoA transferase [Bradyrhizobiaceae bacterium]
MADLRILDVTQAFAGPFCTQLLADQGADVIKVEAPEGDVNRTLGPFPADDKEHAYGALFQHCNRNKRGIVVDLKSDTGREVLFRLVEEADALVENFRFGVMERLGLGYETLKARNPRLVYTSIRGFGDRSGGLSPYASFPAVDIIAQAFGGVMSVTGPDPDSPTKIGGGFGDTIPGLFAAFATMSALWEARSSGEGQYVDVAMADAMLAMCEGISTFFSYSGQIPRPSGNRLPDICPFGTVRAKDGWVALAVPPGRQWATFCEAIGRPELGDHPRYASLSQRVARTEEVYTIVEDFTRGKTKAELLGIFGGVIPFSPINDAADIHAEPHYAARDMLPTLDHPGSSRRFTVAGIPGKLSRTPGSVRHRAPLLGEHTEEVLREAGFSAEQIAEFKLQRAVA